MFKITAFIKYNDIFISYFETEEPLLSKVKILTDAQGKRYFSEDSRAYHSEEDFKRDHDKWENTRKEFPLNKKNHEDLYESWDSSGCKDQLIDRISFFNALKDGISIENIKDRIEVICKGCGRSYYKPLGLNAKGKEYFACCPDDNYHVIIV